MASASTTEATLHGSYDEINLYFEGSKARVKIFGNGEVWVCPDFPNGRTKPAFNIFHTVGLNTPVEEE